MEETKSQKKPTEVAAPQLVATAYELETMTAKLAQEPRIAIDTEANSLYAYHERVCLIQISIPGTNYLVDPLALDDLSPLGPILEDENIEKIFHAADYDLMMLRKDFDFHCHNLYDTMWAARILGWPKVGLANILNTHFDVHANKRYQRYNWGKRPLEPEALTYAWMDSYYLLPLREIQIEELHKKGRWEETQEVFDYLCAHIHPTQEHDRDAFFWRIKGVHDLNPQEQKVLYKLHCWRDRQAERLDRPPMKVINNNRLIKLARIQPHTNEALLATELTPYQVRRFGKGLLKALNGDLEPIPAPPTGPGRPPEIIIERYNTLKIWRKERAERRGVDADVILPNAVLWEIAKSAPKSLEELGGIRGIGPWRQKTYGPDILTRIHELPAQL